MKCAGGCGRSLTAGLSYCGPACRDRVTQDLERAKYWSRDADRPDPALDDLGVSNGACRRVLAVLRRSGANGATTAMLTQKEVGGGRAGARVQNLRDVGFEVDCQPERVGSYRYRLVREPTPGIVDQVASERVATVTPIASRSGEWTHICDACAHRWGGPSEWSSFSPCPACGRQGCWVASIPPTADAAAYVPLVERPSESIPPAPARATSPKEAA